MTTFNEQMHPRAGDGTFAVKPVAEAPVDLGYDVLPDRRRMLAPQWAGKEDWELDMIEDGDEVPVVVGDDDAQIVDSVMWQPGEDQLIVGEKIHYTDIDESQHILRSNLRGFGEGYGVLIRCGNWQPASAYDVVVPESRATI